MKTQLSSGNTSTLQEWADFLSVLNSGKKSASDLLQKSPSPDKLLMHLDKTFSRMPQPQIFRRLGKHTQLVLQFS